MAASSEAEAEAEAEAVHRACACAHRISRVALRLRPLMTVRLQHLRIALHNPASCTVAPAIGMAAASEAEAEAESVHRACACAHRTSRVALRLRPFLTVRLQHLRIAAHNPASCTVAQLLAHCPVCFHGRTSGLPGPFVPWSIKDAASIAGGTRKHPQKQKTPAAPASDHQRPTQRVAASI